MNESALYINFIKRNFLILFISFLLGILVSSFLLSQIKSQTKIVQSYKMVYNVADLNQALALTDQAVAELRSQRFAASYPSSAVVIYKPGPMLINIEAISPEKEAAYGLLLKETTYLGQNFSVIAVNQPEVSLVEPSIVKYLLSGALTGFLLGLSIALLKEYLKNF